MKRASEVPPEVLSSGRRPVTSWIAATARSVKAPGLVTNTLELDRSQTIRARIRFPAASVSRCSTSVRSEEHTSELQSHSDLVCRLLLEKKKEYETHFRAQIEFSVTPMKIDRLDSHPRVRTDQPR